MNNLTRPTMNALIRTAVEQIKTKGYVEEDTVNEMTVAELVFAYEQAAKEDAA